jgi:signal transduction histidine kinase/CheY-like chemotaxis protein
MINKTKKYKTAILYFLCGIIVIIFISTYFYQLNNKLAQKSFEQKVDKILIAIQENINQYERGLRGLRGVIITNDQFNWQKFVKYSKSRDYDVEFPGALGFGYIEVVNHKDLARFELNAQKEISKDYKVYNLNDPSKDNFIIKYIYPELRNKKAFGLNIASEKRRYQAALSALKSGEASLTEQIYLVQDKQKKAGGLLFLPIYKENFPLLTEENRIQAIKGFSYAPIIYADGISKQIEKYKNEIDLEIFTINDEVVYDTDGHLSKNKQIVDSSYIRKKIINREYNYVRELKIKNLTWKIKATNLAKFNFQNSSTNPFVIAFILTTIHIAITTLIVSLITIKLRSKELALILTEKYKQKQEEAQNATIEKSNFLANMGHEIKTPLTGIIGLSELLLQTKLDNTQAPLVQNINHSSELLQRLLNDILNLSKLEAGKIELEENEVSIEKTLNDIKVLFQKQALEKNLNIEVNFDKLIAKSHLLDELRLRQVISNFINNSIKFTSTGKISISAELISEFQNTQKIKFSIIDTGIGISKEKLTNLFTPYSQADKSTYRKFGGTGLGLSISKGIIQLMNGSIEIKSKENVGTEIVIVLSFEKYKQSSPKETPSELSLLIPPEFKILIVEDNDINQLIISKIIQNLNLSFELAVNGQEAVNLATLKHFNLILMDLELPDTNGVNVVKLIRKHQKKRNLIIANSAHNEKDIYEKCIESGFDDVISKPLTKLKIENIILKWKDKLI